MQKSEFRVIDRYPPHILAKTRLGYAVFFVISYKYNKPAQYYQVTDFQKTLKQAQKDFYEICRYWG